KRSPASRPAPGSAWRRFNAEEARQFIQAALGRLRRGDEDARGRDVERPGLPVRRRLPRGVPPLHGGAESDQLLRRQDRRGIHAQARKIAALWKRNDSTRWPRASPTCRRGRPSCGGIFDFEAKRKRLEALTRELENPKLWENPQRAQELGKEKKALEAVVATLGRDDTGLSDAAELFQLAKAENDDATLSGISSDVDKLAKDVATVEFRRMFSNPLDANNCFVDIQAGSGGTEAQDW